jgi:tetratricopeptide (TPR) repeat protein
MKLDRDTEATDLYLKAKAIFEALSDYKNLMYCLRALIDNSSYLDKDEDRVEFALEALNLARISDDVSAIGEIAIELAEAYEYSGRKPLEDLTDENYRVALEYSEIAYSSFLNSGDIPQIINSLCSITHYLTVLERDEEAIARIKEAIDLIPDLEEGSDGYSELIGRIYKFKGILENERGHSNEALEDFKRVIEVLPDDEENYDLGVTYWQIANLQDDLGQTEDALASIQQGMVITRRSNPLMYYRLMQLQVQILYVNNREREALFISRGAMLEYESTTIKEIPSHIYVGFILNAGLCLLFLKCYEEMIQVLNKVNSVHDYLMPLNRVSRLEYLLATAHLHLGRNQEAIEILDALLESDDLDETDSDIGLAFLTRAAAHLGEDKLKAKQDLDRSSVILAAMNEESYIDEFMKDFPELRNL